MSFSINFVDNDYNDEHFQDILLWLENVSEEYEKSSYYEQLSTQEKSDSFFLLSRLFDFAYSYCLVGPGKLDDEVLSEVMLDVMPRKISADKDTFESFASVFNNFMLWCEEKKYIKNTERMRQFVTDNTPIMVKASQNPNNWGFAKSFIMGKGMPDVETLPPVINTTITVKHDKPKIGRNDSCTCGSGKKYKRCCGANVQPYAGSPQGSLTEQMVETIKASNVSTIQEANIIAQQISARHNARPTQEFLGLSPEQMAAVLYNPFKSPELVIFNENWLPKHAIALQIFNKLIDGISEEGAKVTSKGNLPLQLCRDILADLPEDLFLRPSRIRTETEFGELHALRLIGEMAGLIKQKKTKLILSSLGQELTQAKNQSGLFNCLLKVYATQFNWGYLDCYPEIEIIQTGWLFSLYCLSIFGNKWRPSSFYADKFLTAFPMALDDIDERPYASVKDQFHHCYNVRTLKRFANFWGLIEMRKRQTPDSRIFEFEIRAPHLSEWIQFHA